MKVGEFTSETRSEREHKPSVAGCRAWSCVARTSDSARQEAIAMHGATLPAAIQLSNQQVHYCESLLPLSSTLISSTAFAPGFSLVKAAGLVTGIDMVVVYSLHTLLVL